MGFCIYNNVALAARQARLHWGAKRVLIVDWDVHHGKGFLEIRSDRVAHSRAAGNGTQRMFEEDPSVLYFSVHRYDNANFYPYSKDAAPEAVGKGAGAGFSVNVAWNSRVSEIAILGRA